MTSQNYLCITSALVLKITLLAALTGATTEATADVKLPAIFSDHAVLQREMKVPVWGWADPGEDVSVSIAGQTLKTKADATGKWRVTLEPLSVGEPLTLVVEGKNRVERKDLLVGEVWLCSGQSNMEWPVKNSTNGDLEATAANEPNIRMITVGGLGSQEVADDFKGEWNICSPKTVGEFSAVGYYFGRELEQQLGVPIGLIDNAWGGSACEAWIRRDLLDGQPMYQPMIARYDEQVAEFEQKLADWNKKADEARAEGKSEPPGRPSTNNPATGNSRPANIYNTRIKPITPYAIRGAIWYQGETNAGRAFQYRDMFPLMIQNWRDDWGQGDFPFYWVQLADFKPEKSEPGDSDWAELREAQTMTLDRLANTGEAVIIDIGEASDIHPRNKLEVARRLVRWALARDYGRDFKYRSPRYDSMEVQGAKIVVKFKDVTDGLRTIDAKELKGFAVAGSDKKWAWADAKILDKDRVEVTSETVLEPVAVRYAWADNPVCNLYDKSGLPATPFRSDDWPGVTHDAQ